MPGGGAEGRYRSTMSTSGFIAPGRSAAREGEHDPAARGLVSPGLSYLAPRPRVFLILFSFFPFFLPQQL